MFEPVGTASSTANLKPIRSTEEVNQDDWQMGESRRMVRSPDLVHCISKWLTPRCSIAFVVLSQACAILVVVIMDEFLSHNTSMPMPLSTLARASKSIRHVISAYFHWVNGNSASFKSEHHEGVLCSRLQSLSLPEST